MPPTETTSIDAGSAADDFKAQRRASRQYGLFTRGLAWEAFKRSLVMLLPNTQWKNPVMFVVEVGAVLTLLFTIAAALGAQSEAPATYLVALDAWLWLTVIFANFAEALAEARGKAQA